MNMSKERVLSHIKSTFRHEKAVRALGAAWLFFRCFFVVFFENFSQNKYKIHSFTVLLFFTHCFHFDIKQLLNYRCHCKICKSNLREFGRKHFSPTLGTLRMLLSRIFFSVPLEIYGVRNFRKSKIVFR